MAKAELVAKNVTAEPCDKCGATDKFVQWRKDGKEWLSCGRGTKQDDGTWKNCYGAPITGEQEAPKPAEQGAEAGAVASKGRNAFMSLAFDRLADAFGVISTICAEIQNELKP